MGISFRLHQKRYLDFKKSNRRSGLIPCKEWQGESCAMRNHASVELSNSQQLVNLGRLERHGTDAKKSFDVI